MPFPEQRPLPFNRESILALWPRQTGCYGVFNPNGAALYVGRADDIRGRLLDHLGDPRLALFGARFLAEVGYWPLYDSYEREKLLILEYLPWLNQRVG